MKKNSAWRKQRTGIQLVKLATGGGTAINTKHTHHNSKQPIAMASKAKNRNTQQRPPGCRCNPRKVVGGGRRLGGGIVFLVKFAVQQKQQQKQCHLKVREALARGDGLRHDAGERKHGRAAVLQLLRAVVRLLAKPERVLRNGACSQRGVRLLVRCDAL